MSNEASGEEIVFPVKRILLPVDGSKNSLRAANVAIALAKQYDSELLVLNVVAPYIAVPPAVGAGSYPIDYQSYYDDAEKEGSEIVERIAELAKTASVRVQSLVERSGTTVVESVVNVASDQKVDLIIIGTRGLGGFKRLLLGSVSGGVVSHAHCNVLIVR
jgi:nucleotide-binding universal stress UspA family protein